MRVSLIALCLIGLVAAVIVGGCGHKQPTPPPPGMTPMAPPSPTTTPTPPAPTSTVTGKALGKTIFTTGDGALGTHIEFEKGGTQFKAKPGGCAECHGADGKGKKVGKLTIPDIRASVLIAKHGTKASKYTWATLKKAVTEGIGASGKPLADAMPRWKLTDEEFSALTAFMAAASKPVAKAATKPAIKAAPKTATKAPTDTKTKTKATTG